jgi:hypothetical protein
MRRAEKSVLHLVSEIKDDLEVSAKMRQIIVPYVIRQVVETRRCKIEGVQDGPRSSSHGDDDLAGPRSITEEIRVLLADKPGNYTIIMQSLSKYTYGI